MNVFIQIYMTQYERGVITYRKIGSVKGGLTI